VRVGPPTERRRRLDRFEIVMAALGGVFLALSIGSVVALVTLIASIGDVDPEFPGSVHLLIVIRGLGIGLFAVMAVVTFGVANWLVGGRLWAWVRARFRRG
jgi:hypothetical protein